MSVDRDVFFFLCSGTDGGMDDCKLSLACSGLDCISSKISFSDLSPTASCSRVADLAPSAGKSSGTAHRYLRTGPTCTLAVDSASLLPLHPGGYPGGYPGGHLMALAVRS